MPWSNQDTARQVPAASWLAVRVLAKAKLGGCAEVPVNDTELIQRGEGLFTEGRWRKQSIAEVLALNTHIKRHPSVESCGEAPRSAEQEKIRTT